MRRALDTAKATAAVAATLAAALAGGCGDFREPYNLNYARILAVRATPPSIEADGRSRIDLLAAGADGVPFEADPATVGISAEAAALAGVTLPPEIAMLLSCADAGAAEPGCHAQAPDQATLNAVKAALGLPADAVLTVPLRITFPLATGEAVADKILFVGRAGANPTITEVTVDGAPLPAIDADPLPLGKGEHTLAVAADGGDAAPIYFWYVGEGKIEKYREPVATLTFKTEIGVHYLGVVVRHDKGGAAWRFGRVVVE